jgi:hypothetical protein
MLTMSTAIEAIPATGTRRRAMAFGWLAAGVLAALLAGSAGARADNPALQRPSVVSPYRFAPPDTPASPLEDQKAQQYRFQLQKQIFDYDRSSKPLTPLQDQRLRDARGDLDRMNQILLPPN